MTLPPSFRAFVVEKRDDGFVSELRALGPDDLPAGEVTIRVEWSSVNYKDGLASTADGRVARISPLVPGIDLAGEVVESAGGGPAVGEKVLVHGYDLGVAHHGGYAEYARVPAGWVVPLPRGLTTRQAMAIGTAGFTAALSIVRLEREGLAPGNGRVLVTGASGGVGSTAVAILAARGYEVVASTGSANAHDYLRTLGAAQVIDRAQTSASSDRPLERAQWAGAVDPVGGSTLAYILRTLNYGGSVAVSGLTGGTAYTSTVHPFILRGVSVLGIDSVNVPIEQRIALWERLAGDLRPPHLDDSIAHEIPLSQMTDTLSAILRGKTQGRVVVRVLD